MSLYNDISQNEFKIELSYDGKDYIIEILNELKIIPSKNLNKALQEQPTLFFFFNSMLVNLDSELRAAKNARTKKSHELTLEYSVSIETDYYLKARKYPNLDILKAMVETNKFYQRLLKTEFEIQKQRDTVASIVEALKNRQFILQTLSANNRAEQRI